MPIELSAMTAPKTNSYFLIERDTLKVRLGPIPTREEARAVKRTYQDSAMLQIGKTVFSEFVR